VQAGVWQLLAALNRRWNAWKPGSELRALNEALRAGRSATVAPDLQRVLRQCAELERASQGLFNPAIGAWVNGWGFHADRLADGAPPPTPQHLAAWQAQTPTLAALQWRGAQVRSHLPGLQLDLGAIGKGVALDLALDHLARQGVQHALLNLGGNLAASGLATPHDGPVARAWQVGVRHPQGPGLAALMRTQGREAVVTSGVYERQRRLPGGPWAHHVLDPRLARPSTGLASVTVVHASAALADAGATALLVAGPQHWRPLAGALGLDQVLAIDDAGRHQVTPAMAARLLPLA
jgi:thiamine biosynthesis lipoprotein